MSEHEILDVPNASKIDGAIKEIESFDFIECNQEIDGAWRDRHMISHGRKKETKKENKNKNRMQE